ncbi:MAG: ferritin family protein [Candidatus Omnitrophica bacterium]|nr:ferritin family protein [Candidatus Omnitrophota bacterium]
MDTTAFLIEVIESFLSTLGYAFVFYFVIRKLQKSWPTLVISVSIFSLVVLAIWWKIFGLASPDDAIGDITGIFLAILTLSILFRSHAQRLAAPPKGVSYLRTNAKIKHIHLRHLLQIGMNTEERGRNFYSQLAKKAVEPKVKKLCQKLAADETKHKKFLQNIFSRWLTPPPMDQETAKFIEQQLVIYEIFLHPPTANATIEEMIKYAIKEEEKMADFYLSFEKAFPVAWKRMYIQLLMMEERSHASLLINAFPQFK